MLDKKLYISKRISGAEGRLDYYLTEGVSTEENIVVYGVEINKVTYDGEVENIQSERINDISPTKENVLSFLYFLSDMEVMPVTLEDVVKDLIEDDFFMETILK
jgi:hypothetical protein